MSLKALFLAVALCLGASFAQDSTASALKIIFAGDLMGHVTQINAAKKEAKGKGYNYRPVYKHLESYFSKADLAIINLEYPLAGEPYSGFPQFSSPDESVFAIKDVGFNILATANNHSLDRGKQGLERTLYVLDSMGLEHLGTYRHPAERDNRYPLFIEKNGIKIAFLNYTYGTNMLMEEEPNIVNRIDSALISGDIRKAKLASPDFIIALMHWGVEYENTQNQEQKDLAQFLAANGVNLIIGSHPHVVQPFDKIFAISARDSVPVIYSLGNFISNQRNRYTDGGIVFEVNLQKNSRMGRRGGVSYKTDIMSYGYMPFWVYRYSKNNDNVFRLLPECKTYPAVCKEYKINPTDKAAMEQFFDDTKKLLHNVPIIKPY
ncbi:MAG: CapA family protein [Fibromonadaceae bacterium]|jgi:poly-gamma-glutamate synthesis protein (capsule biosynthesis protein)|nr:CapA family protein [Fibromonadaceae bacterium]